MKIQIYPPKVRGNIYKATGTLYVFSEDEFRFALCSAELDGIQVKQITLPLGSLGIACKNTLDKFLSIKDNVVSDDFKLIWRG